MEFLGQGSDPSCSLDLSHSSGSAGSLSLCAGPGIEPASSTPKVPPVPLCHSRNSSSSYKDISPIGLGPHPYDLINPNYFLKGSVSQYSHMGAGALTYEFGENVVQSVTQALCNYLCPCRGSKGSSGHSYPRSSVSSANKSVHYGCSMTGSSSQFPCELSSCFCHPGLHRLAWGA